jgi:hypothetical protein
MTREGYYGMGLAAIAAAILYWLSKQGLLHESVTGGIVTPDGTIASQSGTGIPQYDITNPSTFDEAQLNASVPPLDQYGKATQNPSDPTRSTCPIGYTLYHEVTSGAYWCLPNSNATKTAVPFDSQPDIPISQYRLNGARNF